MIIRAAKTGTITHRVDVGCQNIQREFLKKAFHYIIAPAEKYTIFKNKSKRKLTTDNPTMLGLLLQCTLIVSETG